MTRRQALQSLAALAAGTLLKAHSVFGEQPGKIKIRFPVVGDCGTGNGDQINIAKEMFAAHRQSPFDFAILAGDNIYPNGNAKYFAKHFEQPFAALLKEQVRFYAVLGNHDVREGRQDQIRYPLFNMGGQNYYTLQFGNGLLDIFMLDSTDCGTVQLTWVEQQLRHSAARWKLAVFHHPLYSSGTKHGSDLGLRRKLEPLFVRYGVNAAFSGHDHIYERVMPQQGVQYFVTGAGGDLYRGGVDLRSPFRAASYDEDNHFMLLEVSPDQIDFQAITETGRIIDRGVIKQTAA
ncbi:MAG TPA: metallophosphoesterase [Terriglobia bacterium]|jgi:3',5'-cyclic AMP phosphodiesterase CpdA